MHIICLHHVIFIILHNSYFKSARKKLISATAFKQFQPKLLYKKYISYKSVTNDEILIIISHKH